MLLEKQKEMLKKPEIMTEQITEAQTLDFDNERKILFKTFNKLINQKEAIIIDSKHDCTYVNKFEKYKYTKELTGT
jgi:hypothetical protein